MRITYNVVYLTNRWIVTSSGDEDSPIRENGPTPTLSVNTSKFWAYLTARKFARNLYKNGMRSRVAVYHKNGDLQFSHSYGNDDTYYTFNRDGKLVVNLNSLLTSKKFKLQIEAAENLRKYQEELKKSKTE